MACGKLVAEIFGDAKVGRLVAGWPSFSNCKHYGTLLMLFNPILVGGGQICPPGRIFNNSARKVFIDMKLLDFLQLLIVQLLKMFH